MIKIEAGMWIRIGLHTDPDLGCEKLAESKTKLHTRLTFKCKIYVYVYNY